MELSISEAEAQFTEVVAAAARGERVVVTKHGRPFVELIAAHAFDGMDFEKGAVVREAIGLSGLSVIVPPTFDDPAFSHAVLGLVR